MEIKRKLQTSSEDQEKILREQEEFFTNPGNADAFFKRYHEFAKSQDWAALLTDINLRQELMVTYKKEAPEMYEQELVEARDAIQKVMNRWEEEELEINELYQNLDGSPAEILSGLLELQKRHRALGNRYGFRTKVVNGMKVIDPQNTLMIPSKTRRLDERNPVPKELKITREGKSLLEEYHAPLKEALKADIAAYKRLLDEQEEQSA